MRHPKFCSVLLALVCAGLARAQTVEVDGTVTTTGVTVSGTNITINASAIGSTPGTFNEIKVYVSRSD